MPYAQINNSRSAYRVIDLRVVLDGQMPMIEPITGEALEARLNELGAQGYQIANCAPERIVMYKTVGVDTFYVDVPPPPDERVARPVAILGRRGRA